MDADAEANATTVRHGDGDVGASAGPESPPSPVLQPWEQHGGVIHMPRYLYSSHADPLLHRSGFLITCAFQREKSATKEAMEVLHEYLGVTKRHDDADIEPDAKRARTGTYSGLSDQKSPGPKTKAEAEPLVQEGEETRAGEVEEQILRPEIQGELGGARKDEGPHHDAARDRLGVGNAESLKMSEKKTALNCKSAEETKQQEFRLVKLARNGMVYISISSRSPGDLLTFFTKILKEFHTRSRALPRWCHRLFPVQATCLWTKADVRSNVVILVKEFIQGHYSSSNTPLKYAVAVNRRGLEEKVKTGEAATSTDTFGKLECIHAVAEAVQSVTPYTSVDLTNPQMVVMLEVLPLVRVETSVCAVSVLPRELVVTKPKLQIRALAPPKKQK